MTSGWAVAAVIAAVAALVWAAVSVLVLMRLRRMELEQRVRLGQLELLEAAVRAMELRLDGESSQPAGRVDAEARQADAESEPMQGESIDPEVAPEIQAAIAAAAIAAVGEKARVRAVRAAGPAADASAWSQQGRMLVQTSHNMRTPR